MDHPAVTAHGSSAWPFVCSVCGEPLRELRGTLKCRAGHSFDIAKEGYVNLLAPADAERGISGDTRDMLHARRRFLDSGHFAPLREALGAEVREALAARGPHPSASCVLEVGCGEGYYIGGIAASASAGSATATRYVGLDVSKDAVRLAARRYASVRFAVANVRRRLYVGSGSVNALLSVFAPRNAPEFRRVLADDGTLIVVIPGPAHMSHVRDAYGLLDVEEAKEARLLEQFGEHFSLAARQVIEYPVVLAPDHVRDFVGMGPSARHPRPAGARFDREIRTLASFIVLRLRRRARRPRGGRDSARETIMRPPPPARIGT